MSDVKLEKLKKQNAALKSKVASLETQLYLLSNKHENSKFQMDRVGESVRVLLYLLERLKELTSPGFEGGDEDV